MTTPTPGNLIRATILIGMLTGTAVPPAFARDGGGGGDGPAPSATVSRDCELQKKLEKAETNVTALQFEYRSLSDDLKKAEKGSKEEKKLQRRLNKVSKRLSKERDKAAEYFRQVADRQFNGIGC